MTITGPDGNLLMRQKTIEHAPNHHSSSIFPMLFPAANFWEDFVEISLNIKALFRKHRSSLRTSPAVSLRINVEWQASRRWPAAVNAHRAGAR